jgi:hypothetical protein
MRARQMLRCSSKIKPTTAADPNVRIANVAAMRNILKYWVAYHLALDPDEDVQRPAA